MKGLSSIATVGLVVCGWLSNAAAEGVTAAELDSAMTRAAALIGAGNNADAVPILYEVIGRSSAGDSGDPVDKAISDATEKARVLLGDTLVALGYDQLAARQYYKAGYRQLYDWSEPPTTVRIIAGKKFSKLLTRLPPETMRYWFDKVRWWGVKADDLAERRRQIYGLARRALRWHGKYDSRR